MQTKEQKRAAYALEAISGKFDGRVDEKTANFIVGVPTMVLANGVGQTMAFLLSKKDEAKHRKTFEVLREWLSLEVPGLRGPSEMAFLKNFSALEQNQYLRAQREAVALLQWLNRYARAFQE